MKATELRINDWFLSVKFQIPVKCELTDLEQLCVMSDGAYADPPIEEMFEPIPLTEEWLLKFGFEQETRMGEEKYYKGMYLIENGISQFFDNGYSFRITTDNQNSTHTASVKYVHQLQNLYFALTGEELTIKL